MQAMGPVKSVAMILISLALGYLVCAKAEEQKGKFIKQLGYWIGAIIIIVSLLAALKGLCCSVHHKMLNKCPDTNKGFCPAVLSHIKSK